MRIWCAVPILAGAISIAATQAPRRVAVDFTDLDATFQDRLGALPRFDSLIASELHSAGFEIVPPDSTAALWNAGVDSVGGLFDTYTGDLLTGKRAAVRERTLHQLRTHFGATVWLHPEITQKAVKFKGSKVTWDGTTEQTGASGGVIKALFGSDEGTMQVLSLEIVAENMAGQVIYQSAAGIQLLSKVHGESLRDVIATMILTDADRNAAAVHAALAGLPVALKDSTP